MMSPHSMWKPARQTAMSMQQLPECAVNKDSLKKYAPYLAEVDRYIRQCPVMTLDGECKPISKLPAGGTSIANLREFFYVNLHSEFPLYYFFLFSNVIAPATLGVLGTSRIVDHPPLVDTEEYRSVLERIIPLRAQIVFQLMQDMQGYHFNQEFGITWLRPSSDKASTPIIRPPEIKLDEWTDIQDKLHDFHSVIEYERNATSRATYDTVHKAHAAVLLKSLDLLGYFTHAAHVGAQAEVSSASVYATALKHCDGYAETGVLLIELIRTQTLNDNLLKGNDAPLGSGVPGANLAARILSLVDVDVAGRWDAPISPALLAFNAVIRAFQRSLRSLTEVISTMLFITRRNDFPLSNYKKMATFLPFGTPLSTYAGVIGMFMMENKEYGKLNTKAGRMALLKKTFPACPNLEADLQKMHYFWGMSDRVITTLVTLDEGMDRTIADKIRKEANALMQKAFEHVVPK
jgi:hypothetical protein